jgi:programmed cell death 6-interacting protein
MKNLAFERCGVLFNLAALYSQLAEREDRQTKERIKKARVYYQVREPLQRRFCISA